MIFSQPRSLTASRYQSTRRSPKSVGAVLSRWVFAFLFAITATAADAQEGASPSDFEQKVAPFLSTHCVSCHGGDDAEGGIVLDRYRDSANVQEDYELWEKILRLINEHQMPPADEPQPTSDEIVAVSDAIESELAKFDCTAEKHPGRVTIQRLNKAEYNNTIRDLVGLDLRLADDFPSDDVGNGFDNIGDVLTIPPILLEKYLAAATVVADRVYENEDARQASFPARAEIGRAACGNGTAKRRGICRARPFAVR